MTKFKELLKQCDLHGAQLARRIGVSVPLVHCWTNGTSAPRVEVIPKIASALGVPIEVVVGCFENKATGENGL